MTYETNMKSQPDYWICLQSQEGDGFDNRVNCTSLNPDNRGLAYGDGFFTTMSVMDSVILWEDYHRQRMVSHANALQLDIDSDRVLISLQAHAEQLQQGMLKLIVTRASQSVRGYHFTPTASGSACEIWLKSAVMKIATSKYWQLPDNRPVPMQPTISAVCLTSRLACLPPPLAGLKSLNRLDNVLASGELQAIKQQPPFTISLGEGLVRDMSGHWVEGTMSNVFYQLDAQNITSDTSNASAQNQGIKTQCIKNQWFTPPLEVSGVRGVMRAVIMQAFADSATPIIERALTDNDLPQLSRLFFCNAVRGIMPVNALTLLTGEVVNFK